METNEIEEKQKAQFQKMTETQVAVLISLLSIPTVISMLITNIYNLVDTAFVGSLGTSASGAVGVVFGFMAIIMAFGFMFGQGSGSMISRYLGARDLENATKTASTAFFSAFFFGLLITIVGFIFLDPMVYLLGSTKTIAPYAKTYISYILLASPFMCSSFTLNNILRYEGRAKLGMIGLLAGSLLNIFGDAFFMKVLHFGISGAGLATALSQMISFAILISMFITGRTETKLKIKEITLQKEYLGNMILTGFPSLLRQGLNSITTVLLNTCSAPYGDEAVAAMSIVSRIIFFVFAVALGIGQGFQPVSGYNYGAQKYSRVRKGFWFTLFLGEALMLCINGYVFFHPDEMIRLFRDDYVVVTIAHRALLLQCMTLPFLPLSMVTEMLYQSTGYKIGAIILSSLRSGLFFIPLLLILSKIKGLEGIQEAQPIAYVLSFFTSACFLAWYLKKLPKEDGRQIE